MEKFQQPIHYKEEYRDRREDRTEKEELSAKPADFIRGIIEAILLNWQNP
ncbi:MAG: hypothetical protein LUG98_16755 [Tannerellaceae bacterium]|nr:hypothetical protein [Tannerellaceae bacterium]